MLARRGGAAEVGEYGIAVAVFALLEAAGSLGFRHLLAREFAGRSDARLFGTASLLCLVSGAVLAVLLAAASLFVQASSTRLVLIIIAPALPLSGILVVAEGFWIGTERVKRLIVALLSEQAFRLIGGWIVVLAWPSAVGLVGVFVMGRAVAAFIARPPGGLRLRDASSKTLTPLTRHIPTFLGLEVAFQLYWRVDVVLLSLMTDRNEVGYYVAAYRIFSGLLLLPQSYGQVLLPRLVRSGVASNTRRALWETTAMGSIAVLVVVLFSHVGIELLYGVSFSASASILCILALGLLPASIDQPLGRALVAKGQQNMDLAAIALATAANIVLNLLLIPVHGANGAAIASVIALVVSVAGHSVALHLRWKR
jgi:O-antigen/teichoic acid export membrane protein